MKISDPLTSDEERAELMPKYDALAAMIESYRIRDICRQSPSTRALYLKLGLIKESDLE